MEEEVTAEITTTKRTTTLKVSLMMPSSPKSPMSSGKMSQDFRMPRMHSKKLSFCPLDSNKFSQEVENLGREFCFMVLQEQEKHILLKLVQLKLRELSSQCPLLIS